MHKQPPALTPRESSVLECMARALGCKETAKELGIGEHTVRKYRSRLMEKFGKRSPQAVVTDALAQGLLATKLNPGRCHWPQG